MMILWLLRLWNVLTNANVSHSISCCTQGGWGWVVWELEVIKYGVGDWFWSFLPFLSHPADTSSDRSSQGSCWALLTLQVIKGEETASTFTEGMYFYNLEALVLYFSIAVLWFFILLFHHISSGNIVLFILLHLFDSYNNHYHNSINLYSTFLNIVTKPEETNNKNIMR